MPPTRSLIACGLAVLAAGCHGGGGSAATAPASTPRPQARLTVTYAVGWGTRLGHCPAATRCRVVHRSGTPIKVASYTLRCPARAQSARARCAAALWLIRRRAQGTSVCGCPGSIYNDRMLGTYRSRKVSVALTACGLCALGGVPPHLLDTLLPRAVPA